MIDKHPEHGDVQPKLRRRRSQQRLIIYISAAVAVICVVLAVIVGRATEMEEELLRFGIQFLLIVVLGAVITIVVEIAKRRLDFENRQREYRIETFTSHVTHLSKFYQGVKQVRHKLKAIDLARIERGTYLEFTNELRDLKQDAEVIWRDMKYTRRWLGELDDVQESVERMEKSLDGVDKESEGVAKSEEEFNAKELRALNSFLIKSWPQLHKDYYDVRERLAKLLAENWTGLSEEAPGRSGRAERFRTRQRQGSGTAQ